MELDRCRIGDWLAKSQYRLKSPQLVSHNGKLNLLLKCYIISYTTVNKEIFTQETFSCISHRALDARKFDVNKNYCRNRSNRINWYVRTHLAARICLLMLDARKLTARKYVYLQ